jgi:hypothetical protein
MIAAPAALPSERDHLLGVVAGPKASAQLNATASQSSAQQSLRPDQPASRIQLSRLPSPTDSDQATTVPLPRGRPPELLALSAALPSERDYQLRGSVAGPEASARGNAAAAQEAQQSPRPEHSPSGIQLSRLPSPTDSDQAEPLPTVPLPRARPQVSAVYGAGMSPPPRKSAPRVSGDVQSVPSWSLWPFGAATTAPAAAKQPAAKTP